MSIKVAIHVWERYPGGGSEMLLALALADYAHDDGNNIFPSVETLAKKTRQSERTVQKQLGIMRESGWLEVVARPKGGRYPTVYRINPVWLSGADSAPLAVQKLHPSVHVEGCNSERSGVQETTRGVQQLVHPTGEAATAPDPSLNLQEPSVKQTSAAHAPTATSQKKKRDTPIPNDFSISSKVREWAEAHGHADLDEHLAAFRLKCLAKGYQYANWDAAFMGAIRGNWAGLTPRSKPDSTAVEQTSERAARDAEDRAFREARARQQSVEPVFKKATASNFKDLLEEHRKKRARESEAPSENSTRDIAEVIN
jgi:hypothetical protein